MNIQYGAQYNECNNSFSETDHAPHCTGNCKRLALSDIDVDIHNETILWQQRGMDFQGVPGIKPPLPQPGIHIDLLRLECQVQAFIQLLSEEEQEQFADKTKEILLQKLQNTRKAYEATQEAVPGLLVPKPTLLIPGTDGNGEIKH